MLLLQKLLICDLYELWIKDRARYLRWVFNIPEKIVHFLILIINKVIQLPKINIQNSLDYHSKTSIHSESQNFLSANSCKLLDLCMIWFFLSVFLISYFIIKFCNLIIISEVCVFLFDILDVNRINMFYLEAHELVKRL